MKSTVKGFIVLSFILILVGFQVIPAQAVDNTCEKTTDEISIGMKIDSNDVLVNGESRKLENAPFFKNGIAYVPLKEIVDLCGGMAQYFPSKQSVMIALKKNEYVCFSEIWIGKPKLLCPGENLKEEPIKMEFVFPINKYYMPIIKNNRTFVPADYFSRFGYAEVSWNAERKRIIMSADSTLRVCNFKIWDNFALLDEDIKKRFKNTGRIDDGLPGEIYSDGDMELTLAKSPSEKGVLEIRKIVLLNEKYSTPRGLKVGDSVDRYMDLYEAPKYDYPNFLQIEKNDGKITKIIIKPLA